MDYLHRSAIESIIVFCLGSEGIWSLHKNVTYKKANIVFYGWGYRTRCYEYFKRKL